MDRKWLRFRVCWLNHFSAHICSATMGWRRHQATLQVHSFDLTVLMISCSQYGFFLLSFCELKQLAGSLCCKGIQLNFTMALCCSIILMLHKVFHFRFVVRTNLVYFDVLATAIATSDSYWYWYWPIKRYWRLILANKKLSKTTACFTACYWTAHFSSSS